MYKIINFKWDGMNAIASFFMKTVVWLLKILLLIVSPYLVDKDFLEVWFCSPWTLRLVLLLLPLPYSLCLTDFTTCLILSVYSRASFKGHLNLFLLVFSLLSFTLPRPFLVWICLFVYCQTARHSRKVIVYQMYYRFYFWSYCAVTVGCQTEF